MAYILGFTFADGNVYKTTLSWDLKDDWELLEKINIAMNSNYPISKHKASFRLKISNPIIIDNINRFGVLPNKSKKMMLPKIPLKYFSHFARGFFDGDGWVYIRESRNEISVGFSSGSRLFLEGFVKQLSESLGLTSNNVRAKHKITKKGTEAVTYQVDYFWENAFKILNYFYSNLTKNDLFLERKSIHGKKAIELYEWVKSGGRKWRAVEKDFNQPMSNLLSKYWTAGYNGPQIADILGVHHSSIYRWLIKTDTRPAFTEIRRKGVVNGQ